MHQALQIVQTSKDSLRGMPYWLPIVVDTVVIDLSHLEPFEFEVTPKGESGTATISVRFHDHCFTETFDPSRHPQLLQTSQASLHERRAFSPERYALSKYLPEIVRDLEDRRIASTREGNMVRVTLADGKTYPMFFTLRRVGARRVNMFVVSAYAWTKSGRPSTTGEMKFSLAIAKVLRGEPLKFPPR